MALNQNFNSFQYKHRLPISNWQANPKTQTYLEIILSFGAILFFSWFALYPTLITISELYSDIQSLQVISEKMDNKINALAAAQTQYAAAQTKLSLLDEALPEEVKLAEFLAQVEVLAGESNMLIRGVNFDDYYLEKQNQPSNSQLRRRTPGQPAQEWQSVMFRITAEGRYENARQLIESLQSMRRVVIIDTFGLSQPNNSVISSGEVLNLNITGQLVYY